MRMAESEVILFFLFPQSALLLEPISGGSKFRHVRVGGAACCHTVVVSHVSLNVGCVDPS